MLINVSVFLLLICYITEVSEEWRENFFSHIHWTQERTLAQSQSDSQSFFLKVVYITSVITSLIKAHPMATLEVNRVGKYNLPTRRSVSSHIIKADAMRQASVTLLQSGEADILNNNTIYYNGD